MRTTCGLGLCPVYTFYDTMPFQVATYPGIDKSLLRLVGWCFKTRDQLIIISIKFVHTSMHILDPLLNQDIA
jgi:hypothetical protein